MMKMKKAAAHTVPGYSVGSLKKRITRRHYYKENTGCFFRLKIKAGCLKSQVPRQGHASRQCLQVQYNPLICESVFAI